MGKILENLLSFADDAEITRNELSLLTGLSNSYLISLAKGDIKKVGRDKLIFIAVAFNLSLEETNNLMSEFQLADINFNDANIYIQAAARRKITGIQSLYRGLNLYLFLISLYTIPGNTVLLRPDPHIIFESVEYRKYIDKKSKLTKSKHYNVVYDLREYFISYLKEKVFTDHKYDFDYLICGKCFDDYLNRAITIKQRIDEQEIVFVAEHLQNLISYMNDHPNYRVYILNKCHSMAFVMKYSALPNDNPKVFFAAPMRHGASSDFNFAGFATDAKRITSRLSRQYQLLKNDHTETLTNDEAIAYMKDRFKKKFRRELS